MENLSKAILLFGLELSASLYIGIGVYSSVVGTTTPMGLYLSVWSSLLFGAGLLACIRGVFCFGPLRHRILGRQEAAAQPEPVAPPEPAAESQPAA